MGQKSAGGKIKVFVITVTSYSLVLFRLVFLVSWAKGQSCGPRVSARLLTEIPCDMGRSSYCTTPGSAYPWTSVKRYILDNQGLVRRMYGDVTHGSVLRHEMDLETFRYDSLFIPEVRIRTGRARTGKNTKPNRRRSRPQIFPDDITTITTEDLGSYETIFRVVTQTSLNFGTDETTASYASSNRYFVHDSVHEPQTTPSATTDTENVFFDTVPQSQNTPATESTSETKLSTSTLNTLPEPEAFIKTTAATESVTGKTTTIFPTVETTDTNDKFQERVDAFTEATEKDDRKFGAAIDYDYIPLTRIEIISDNSLEAKAYAEDDLQAKEDVDDVYEVKMPEDEPTEAEEKETEEGVTEEAPPKRGICRVQHGQQINGVVLSQQDASRSAWVSGDMQTAAHPAASEECMVEDKYCEHGDRGGPTGIYTRNACPVKNEVIAPYWANNTRGETLALLNVYPFEQYVHFEKCAFENHQMLCREGCRCEQQFRLHRLLAFDPKNECRGIFSDWFRFPSCCVCICYDVITEQPKIRGRTGRLEKEDLRS